MSTTTIPITSPEQWHAERAKDVTSTQVAALFGVNPYLTEFELWHQKRNGIVEAIEQNERMGWGNRLERTIAEGFVEERGYNRLRQVGVYTRLDGERIGASFDFVADTLPMVPSPAVLIECKNVDGYEWADKWTETEAPPHIELQVQTQMMVSGIGHAFIVALVGGNRLVAHERTPDEVVQTAIRERVRAFWRSIESGTQPQPDYVRDADYLLSRIYNRSDGREIEADAELTEKINEWLAAKAVADTVRPLQAILAERIGTASKVRTPQGVLSCATNKAGARPFRYYPNKEIARV